MRFIARQLCVISIPGLIAVVTPASASDWPPPSAPSLAESRGYVEIPDAAIPRDSRIVYKAVFDITAPNQDPAAIAPQLLRIALQINGLRNAGVPNENMKFVAVFHGDAADALLTDAAYAAKHGRSNPSLRLLRNMKKAGVRILICGQYVAKRDWPRSSITPEAEISEAATLVIIRLQNLGYALVPDR